MAFKKVAKTITKVCAETVFYTACGMAGGLLAMGVIGAIDKIRNC